MTHLFLIDPLERLNIAKDSSLYLALSWQRAGHDVKIIFIDDLFFCNLPQIAKMKCYSFAGNFQANTSYLSSFVATESEELELNPSITLHMRVDPPFDLYYLQILWLLQALELKFGIKVVNRASGILHFQEKLFAYAHPSSIPSFYGHHPLKAWEFAKQYTEIVIKPADLYQGKGVEKWVVEDQSQFDKNFSKKLEQCHGRCILQPYQQEIERGEVRAIYFKEQFLGSILKVPASGSFISNLAAGASFSSTTLTQTQKNICQEVARQMAGSGVDLIAFDLIGDKLSEVNITCPGLLIQVAEASQRDLAAEILKAT